MLVHVSFFVTCTIWRASSGRVPPIASDVATARHFARQRHNPIGESACSRRQAPSMNTRLDVALVDRGLYVSRNAAKQAIQSGVVKVNGVITRKASAQVSDDASLTTNTYLEIETARDSQTDLPPHQQITQISTSDERPNTVLKKLKRPDALMRDMRKAQAPTEVLRALIKYKDRDKLRSSHLCVFWHTLGRMKNEDAPGAETWMTKHRKAANATRMYTLEVLPKCNLQELTGVAQSMVKAGLSCECAEAEWADAFDVISDAVASNAQLRAKELNGNSLSALLKVLVPAGQPCPNLVALLAAEAMEHSEKFKLKHLAEAACVFVAAGRAELALFEAIASDAVTRMNDFTAKEITKIAAAFVMSGHALPRLFDALSYATKQNIQEFAPRELASIAWAFARAEYAEPSLFEAIAIDVAGRLQQFDASSLADILHAFAAIGLAAPSLSDMLLGNADRILLDFEAEFQPADTVKMALAFAKIGQIPASLTRSLAEDAMSCLWQFPACELADIAVLFVKLKQPEDLLYEVLAADAMGRLKEFAAEDIAKIAWALAEAGHAHAVFEAFADVVQSRRQDFNPKYIETMTSAFAKVGQPFPDAP